LGKPALDAELQRDAGIRHFEYTAMAALSETRDRTMRISELAALAEGSFARVSQSRRPVGETVLGTPDIKAQVKQLTNTGQRIMSAVDPDDDCVKW
jgi:hypothetical protein